MARRKRVVVLLAVLILCVCQAYSDDAGEFRNFTEISDDDPAMAAAIHDAGETLPQFWKLFERPTHGESDFALKVKITDKYGHEHFWLSDLKRKQGKLYGRIDNDPEIVKSVKLGQRIEIPEKDISDWMYMKAGKMYGNRTIRPLFKQMKPKEVAAMRQLMAEP